MNGHPDKAGTYHFVADLSRVDFSGRLTLGVLSSLLLDCAGFHANERGFGLAHLNEENCTWVLSRLAVELDGLPCCHEAFTIRTWVENVYRLFTSRNFSLAGKDGRIIGYARSVWAMINLQTRKPIDLLSINGGGITGYVCDEPCPIGKPSHIKVAATAPVHSLKARYSDIDMNGHVNSIRYVEHILDLFPLSMYREKRIRRFEMAYVAESYYGDLLSFYMDDTGGGTYAVEIKKNGSETACRAKLAFADIRPE